MKCGEFGVDLQYKYGGKLVGERTRRPLTGKITGCCLRMMQLQLGLTEMAWSEQPRSWKG